jgi:[ribosomal protein S18]-alanine N-acetyltransferase
VIRGADHLDIGPVAQLEAECLGADAWSPWLVEQGIRGELPTVHYVVAEVDRRIVGYAVASIVADIAELQRIAVTESHRRTGIATDLLAAIITRARAGRADRLLLEVRETNEAALAFYAGHGFAEIDRRPRYYRDGATAIVMRRDLRTPPTGPAAQH